MTHEQTIMKALLSDKLVTQKTMKKKKPTIQVRTRVSELRKEGIYIECYSLITPKGEKVYYYELNHKKSKKKALNKYA